MPYGPWYKATFRGLFRVQGSFKDVGVSQASALNI